MSGAHDAARLSAFLDDELPEDEAAEVARHVAGCARCHGELEDLRATRAALRSLPQPEPALSFMVESVLLGPVRDRDAPSGLALGAVVLVSVLLVTAFVVGGDRGPVAPDVDGFARDHVETVGGRPVVVPVTAER